MLPRSLLAETSSAVGHCSLFVMLINMNKCRVLGHAKQGMDLLTMFYNRQK